MSGDYLNWAVFTPGASTGRRATTVEVPTSDQMIFGAYIPQTTVYSYGAPPQTISAHWATTADCTLTQVSSITRDGLPYFPGITMLNTYVGEIDLRQSAVVDYLDVYGGRLKQNDAAALNSGANANAGTLRVDMDLDWTDGTINSNAVAGFLNLAPQATGLIHPADGNDGTVDLGSTLTQLENTSTTLQSGELEVEPGIIHLNAGDGFVVQKGRRLRNAPVPKGVIANAKAIDGEIWIEDKKATTSPDADGVVQVDAGAEYTLRPKNGTRPAGNTGPAVVRIAGPNPWVQNKGKVTMTDRAEMLFEFDSKAVQVGNPGNAVKGFNQQNSGPGNPSSALFIEAGCTITCGKVAQVTIEAGAVIMTERRNAMGVPEATQPPITITGDKATDGILVMTQAALLSHQDAKVPLQLVINCDKGKAIKSVGQIELFLVRDDATKNDQINTDGRVVLIGGNLVMKWFKDESFLPQVNDAWELIKTTYTGAGAAISNAATPVYPDLHIGITGTDDELLVYDDGNNGNEVRMIVERR